MEPIHPNVPFLTGLLIGWVHDSGSECMKIVGIEPDAPDGFFVNFASGARLEVRVRERPAPRQETCDNCGRKVTEWTDPEGGPGRVCKECEPAVAARIAERSGRAPR